MSLQDTVQDLAKSVAMIDADDLPGLVELQDKLNALVTEIESADAAAFEGAAEQIAALGGIAAQAGTLIERIILRDVESEADSFKLVADSIEYTQQLIDNALAGEPVDHLAPPSFDGSRKTQSVDDIDEELLASWISGCETTLGDIESVVLSLENDSGNEETLADIRRTVHTLKGECGVLSLRAAQKLCHEAESLIDRALANNEKFPADEVLDLLDWFKTYVGQLSQDFRAAPPEHEALLARLTSEPPASAAPAPPAGGADSPDASAPSVEPADNDTTPVVMSVSPGTEDNLNEFICESREHIAGAEEALLELEADPEDKELINTVFRGFHTIKGVAGFMGFGPIVEAAHEAETLLDMARQGKITLNSAYLDLILNSCDILSVLLESLDAGPNASQGQIDKLLGKLKRAIKGEDPSTLIEARAASNDTPAPKDAGASSDDKPGAPQHQKKKNNDQTVKVSTGRMDTLVDMVGELVIAHQMVMQDPFVHSAGDQKTQRNMSHVVKIIRDLQEVAMALRMVTLRATFQKMARLVRDVSAKAGKKINFHMEGEDTELDRTVVDEIADPLVHMVRNACDHGIEGASDRVKAGKNPVGNLTLRAYHAGGSIVIEVQDDGRGLPREKILKKAVERGIIPPDRDPESLTDHEINNMIFAPGFSTADKVTDISGRGVGMDVVRRNIEALRGKVEIQSTPGKGSTFVMKLPLTMAIIDGMVVCVGGQRYVLPTLSIRQTYRPTPDEIESVMGRGEMVSVRGTLLPLYRLKSIFKIERGIDDPAEALSIVLENNDKCVALMVDEIIGQQQVVIKSLGQGIGKINGVSGGAILGDGRVAPIIDIAGLIHDAQSRDHAHPTIVNHAKAIAA
ncbi:MAG: chemotaxis protein CheA [Phycisphaerales bacterium]